LIGHRTMCDFWNDGIQNKMPPLIISFYTPDWNYPEFAAKLKSDCERLGLNHHFEKLASTGHYDQNCNLKPAFIRDTIIRVQQPVFWMDIDGTILNFPPIPPEAYKHDIALNRLPWRANPWCVSSMLFNPTQNTKILLNRWISLTDKKIDHDAFICAVKEIKDLSIFELAPEYITFVKKNVPQEACYIVHRVSTSTLKVAYKTRKKNAQ